MDEIGRVVSVGDGIAHVYGLSEIQAGEMAEFTSSVKGIEKGINRHSLFFFSFVFTTAAKLKQANYAKQARIKLHPVSNKTHLKGESV